MATVKTNGTGQALLVIDAATKKPIDIPLKNQEAILAPIVNLRTWIEKYVRTGGIGQMLPGGKIKYYAFPKQTQGRDIEITYDDTTGKINGGMFGAESNGLVGGIDSTYGATLLSDEITLLPAKFLKHRMAVADLEEQGTSELISLKLQDWTNEIAEDAMLALKTSLVAAVGTVGKWASDKGYTVPSTGVPRLQSKTYAMTAADGLVAVADIKAALNYRDKLGLKGEGDPTYPLARGLNSSSSARLLIGAHINNAIQLAVQESQSGFLAGVGIDKELGVINSISYDGKTVPVEVVADMPQKDGTKAFNWLIIEVGKYGAMALPNKWIPNTLVRPSYETLELLFKEIEGVGLIAGLKFLQPELMWGSFAPATSAKVNP